MLGCLCLLCYRTNAQSLIQEKTSSTENQHSICLEIGGRTFVFGSVNYEYQLNEKVSFGGGLGIISLGRGAITRSNNGVPETGDYFDLSSSQMVSGNYFIGKKKNKLYFTSGLTVFSFIDRRKYPSEKETFIDAQLKWNIGVGYQYSGEKMYLRVTGYCLNMPEPNSWFPEYMPWAGISTGIKL